MINWPISLFQFCGLGAVDGATTEFFQLNIKNQQQQCTRTFIPSYMCICVHFLKIKLLIHDMTYTQSAHKYLYSWALF